MIIFSNDLSFKNTLKIEIQAPFPSVALGKHKTRFRDWLYPNN